MLLNSGDMNMIKNSIREDTINSKQRPNSLGWASGDGGFDTSSVQGLTQYGKMRPSADTGFPEIFVSTSAKRATFEGKHASNASTGL